MKQQKIFAFYFFPLIYVTLASIIVLGFGVAIMLDYYIYNDLTLIKSELVTMALFLSALLIGLFLILRDRILIAENRCEERLYNKIVKEISVENKKRIIISKTSFTRSAAVKRKSIIIDDGMFKTEEIPLNNYHHCPRNVSWIIMDYSIIRLKCIKEILSEVPIEWITD